MHIKTIKSIATASVLAISTLMITFQLASASTGDQPQRPLNSDPHSFAEASSLLQVPPSMTATVWAASGMTITFKTNNDDPNLGPVQTNDIPYLVLHHEDGRLTPEISRTLVVTVTDIVLPPQGMTVTIKVDTQNADPDMGVGGTRIRVWDESQWITNSQQVTRPNFSVIFTHEFTDSILYNGVLTATPTDYFRYAIYVDNAILPVIPFQNHAFLMENQFVQPLPQVREDGHGMAPAELIVYYADMFPYGTDPAIPATWKPRADVASYVQNELAPAMGQVFYAETDGWGMDPWHDEWISWRGGKRLSVAMNDGSTWFHNRATDDSSISIRATQGWTQYPNPLDSHLAVFYHEMFHNIQRNYTLHHGRDLGNWPFFHEGQASLAYSVGQPNLQLSDTQAISRQYMVMAKGFLKDDLNTSYLEINAVPGQSGYPAALYWRFLYEQCGQMDVKQGMQVVSRTLREFSTHTADANALVAEIGPVMDVVFADPTVTCPFATFAESLTSFARANYALLLADGRVTTTASLPSPFYYDPAHQYVDPPQVITSYLGLPITVTGEITPSFGMDFIDVKLDPAANTQGLLLEFVPTSSKAKFTVELWRSLTDQPTGKQFKVDPVPAPLTPTASITAEYLLPAIDTTVADHLGLIITRLDPDEATDPNGTYSITVRPVIPLGRVMINGPVAAKVNELAIFTATVEPLEAAVPITYVWQTTEAPPLSLTQPSLMTTTSQDAAFAWSTTGSQLITVTAINRLGAVTNTYAITTVATAPTAITIHGPETGTAMMTYAFSATVEPVTATVPITYVWVATEHTPSQTVSSMAMIDQRNITWATTGTHFITVTATNVGGAITSTHVLTLTTPEFPWRQSGNCLKQDLTQWWFGYNKGVECGIYLLRQALIAAEIPIPVTDPPVPAMLFSTAPFQKSTGSASQTITVQNAHPAGSLSASLVVSHTMLSGTLSAEWNTNSWIGAQFTSLTAPQAQVYDDHNALLATGAVQARPVLTSAIVLALGDSLIYDIQGNGNASFYAPATNGLGVGGNWSTYTAHMQSTGQYGVGLRDAVVTVNGQEYSGTLFLVTSDPVTLSGSGHTLTPNFADRVVIQAQDTKLLVGPSIGTSVANVGSTPLDTSHGFALAGYTGPITITEETADTDHVELNGPVTRDLTLAVEPTNSQVIVGQPTTFTAHISSNTAGLYIVAVEPYQDWLMVVDAQGVISVTPSLGTLPGDYAIRVGAAAADDFTLFATAVHTVTVLPHQGLELNVNPDVLTTVPWGPTPLATAGEAGGGTGVNDGRAQISGVAFTVDITNTSSTAHTFALDVAPATFPSNWSIFGTRRATTATLTLPAGGVGQLGLYFQPPCDELSASCDLPSAGSIHPFTVNAVAIDTGSLSANDVDQFTVPALAFSYLTAKPTYLYSSPGLTTTFDLGLRNVGNTNGAFTLTLTLPITTWSATLPTSQATLAGGEVLTQAITLNTVTGDLGKDYRVSASAPSGPYAPTANVIVHLSSPEVRDIYQAAQDVDGLCVKNVSLQAALHYLGQALEELQAACQYSTELAGSGQATCSTDLRDRVVSGALAVVNHSESISPIITADATLHDIAQELKTQTNWSSIQATIGDLRTAVNDLRTQIVTASRYNTRAWFDPGMRAVLNERPTAFNFNLANVGCAAATYGITLTTSSEAMPLEPTSLEWNLQPGQTLSAPVVVTPTALGAYLLQANLLTREAPQLPLLHTEGSVSVVDALLELTKVTAQPAFVEYGSGAASAVSAQIFNVANIPLDARARVRVLSSTGTEVQTMVAPVLIGSTLLPLDYALGSIDTSSFVTGTYTVAVDIIDESDAVIPKASAQGVLNIGQAVHASSSVSPAIVAPGTVTVTTVITTELDSAIIQSLAQRLLRAPGLAALFNVIPPESPSVTPLAQVLEPSGLILYADPDYSGDAESFTADDPDLGDNVIYLDTASSIVISDSTRAIIFGEPNYQGDWRTITASVPNLTSLGLNDEIESLKILSYPTGAISLTDEFDSETLDPAWNCTAVTSFGGTCSLDGSSGNVRLTIPSGANPILNLQRYDMGRGDFTLETQVTLADYDSQSSYWSGLALGAGSSRHIHFGFRDHERLQVNWSDSSEERDLITYVGSSVYLRVQKQGQALAFAYRATLNDGWQTLTTWYVSDPIEFVGLFAVTEGGALLQADFDTFHLEGDDSPTVVPPDPTPDVHDEFSSDRLRRPWTEPPLVGDAQYSLTDEPGSLRFTLPASDTSSIVEIQRVDMADDWAIQTRLNLAEASICDGDCYRSGLVVGFTPGDYFTFGFAQNRQLRMERFNQYATERAYASSSVEVRIEKAGDCYVFKYRTQANVPWTILDTRHEASRVQWVGLIARSWEPRTAPLILDFAYFDLTGMRVLGNGLKGEYFAGETLSDPPLVTRIDPQVDFHWGVGSPAAEIGTDYFSVRWTGYIEAPTSAVYQFATIADDGTRLRVDGQALIDDWAYHELTTVYGDHPLTLTAGQRYSITLEYLEHDGDASAELWWHTDAFGWQRIPSERLYPVDGVWSLVAEPTALPADGASTTMLTVKLYDPDDQSLEDQLVEVQISGSHNRLNDQPITATDWSEIGYSDSTGVVTATLTSLTAEPKVVRARVQGILLTPEVITFTATEPVGLQILLPGEEVAQGNVNGKTGAPLAQKAGAPFDVLIRAVDAQWNTVSGVTDTLIITSTDPQTTLPTSFALVNGVATATVTLNTLGAQTLGALAPAQATWPLAESGSVLVQRPGIGLIGEYFDNISNELLLARLDPEIDFTWHGNRPAPEIDPWSPFTVHWTGQLEAPTSGAYTFYTSADDGVRVWLDGVERIDGWEPPFTPYDSQSDPITLTAGQRYTLTIAYANFEGDADAHLEWSGPSVPRQIIPSRYLYPDAGFWKADVSPQAVSVSSIITASVQLLDNAEQPLAGVPVSLWGSSDDLWVNGQPLEANQWTSIEDSADNGISAAAITSTVAGTSTLRVRAQNLVLAEPSVTFTAFPAVGLQILLPGEIAVPGTPEGKAGWVQPQLAGQPFEIQVRAIDAYFNTALATGVITLTSTDEQFDGPLTATLDQGVATFSVVLRTADTQHFTAEHVELGQAVSDEIYVQTAPAVSLTLEAPETAPLLATIPLTVTAFDAYGNPAYNQIEYESSDPQAELSGGTSPSIIFYNGGVQTLTARIGTDLIRTVTITLSHDVTVTGDALLPSGSYTYSNVLVASNGRLAIGGWCGTSGVTLYAENMTIEQGGYVAADQQGACEQTWGGAGHDGSGAGHGGQGGARAGVAGGAPYGSVQQPTTVGVFGGALEGIAGGGGGGTLHLIISETLRLEGRLSSDGGDGGSNQSVTGGGGSGGSLWIETQVFTGTGIVRANGGRGNVGPGLPGGGGAGGRIAIYAGTDHFTGNIQVNGGSGAEAGQAGTIYLDVDPESSHITVPVSQPTSLIGEVITVTLVTTTGVPVADEPVSLKLLAGQPLTLSAGTVLSSAVTYLGTTNEAGVVTTTLASTHPGTSEIEAWIGPTARQRRLLTSAAVVIVVGPIDPVASTFTASADTAPNDGLTPITLTVQLVDAYLNPSAQQVVTFTASDPRITLTPPTMTSDANGYARSTVVGTTQQPFTVTARVGEIDLHRQLVLQFIGPDLNVTAQGHATGIAGQNITHTLRVTNTGEAVAPGVILTGELPTPLTLLSADGVYTLTEDGRHIVWEVGPLSAHQVVALTVVEAIDPATPMDEQLVNHFLATTSAEELNLANNSTSISTRVLPAYRFAASLNPAQQTSNIGAVTTYPIVVWNTGNLPDRFTVSIAGLPAAWYTVNPSELVLRPGELAQFTLQVAVTDCAASGVYPITATVTSAGSTQAQALSARLTLMSNPLQFNLSPRDGATIGSTSVLFTWQTPVSTTGTIRLWPIGVVSEVQTYTATAGLQHSVNVLGLQRNTSYQWSAHSESTCGLADSPTQTLAIGNGVVFTRRGYTYSIARDYDQRFDVAVTNEDSVSHTVALTITAPASGDLIVGFTGSGSTDQVLVLEPGETRSATLVLHAQDAQIHDYTLMAQLTADDGGAAPIVDVVPVQVHVTYPELNITFEEIDRDPETLAHTYRVTNHGAALTDLALSVEVISGTGTLYLTPGMTHGYLNTGQRFEFEAYPAIDADFTGLNAQLVATAAGISQTLPVTVTLPEGRSLFLGEADNVSLEVSNRDWYCTNRPIIDNFLQLPNGFRRADMDSAQLRLSLRSQSDVRPHNLAVAVNDQAVGGFQNLIPNGVYTYSVEADYLSEAAYGPTSNDVRFTTTHLNGGHYIVASDVSLGVCLNRYREWVVADSQADADTAVASRSFIVPAPQTLDVEILSPLAGTRLLAGMPVPILVQVNDDINRSGSYIVVVQATNDNGSLMLYDDGYHGDGAARDGVYGGTWWPAQPGTIELAAQAGSCSLTGSDALTVTVRNPLFTTQIDHQIPVSNVQVLTGTYVPDPMGTIFNDQQVQLSWQQVLTPGDHTKTALFQAVLPDMHAGEVREVATGTVINYSGEGGNGQIHLGALSVVAPHLVALTPLSQTIGVGMSGVYQVELYNPAEIPETLTPLVTGLPASWLSVLPSITLPAQAHASLPLTITVPADEVVGVRTFAVVVQTDHGGQDQAAAQLNVAQLLAVQVEPPLNSGTNGQVVTYTATITNFRDVAQHYTLSSIGLNGNLVSLPAGVDVPPRAAVTVPFSITIYTDRGPHPFAITAQVTGTNAVGRGAAVLVVTGDRQVATRLTPQSAEGGPLVPTLYHLIVTNTGSLSDTYQFNVAPPEGWTYTLLANGSPSDRLSLTPYVFNEAELWLIVTPAAGTPPGSYDFAVTTQSLNDPNVHTIANAALNVTGHGVQVEIVPEHTMLNPADSGTWQVLITNTGSLPDSYNLMAGGIVSASAQFVPASVSLAPGESQAVQLTSRDLDFVLPQTYPFAVTARSVSQPAIHNYDTADITFNGYQAVQVELLPAAQTITDSLQASYLMVITNTGNVDTVYRLSAGNPALSLQFETDEVYIPAHMTAGVLLTARASQGGLYFITGSAASLSGPAQDSASALLLIVLTNHAPLVEAGADQTVNEGEVVLLNGSFTDPDTGDTHTIHWNFGDGATASGSLTPTHVYADNGAYTVTLTITDHAGAVGQDTLRVTVNNVVPIVDAGSDQTSAEGESVAFNGTFTDAGTVDTHSLVWDFGDGSTIAGVLTATHVYAENGVYTATLTVTDKDGGSGTDTLLVTVSNVSPNVEAGPDRVTREGTALQFTGTFTDPGTADTHLIEWDFGDGGTATGSLSPTHTYTQSGVYTATLTITDDDGGLGNDTLAVTVQTGVTSCTTVTIQGEGVTDAYIWGTYPDTNYNYDRLYTGKVVDGYKHSLLRFDLSALPVNTTIERATFSLNQFVNSDATTVEAHRIISGWIEDEVTWNSFNNAYDPSLVGSWLPGANGWYSLEVTSLVQAWVAGTWPNHGLLLDQPTGDGHAEYRATEYEDEATERPRLTLCYQGGPELPVADFSAAPVRGAAPLMVTFSNQSTPLGAITAYLWDFGDGTSTSSEPAPTHVYTEIGTYTVTLQITAGGQTYQKTQTDYINVTSFPSTGVLDDFNRAPGGVGNHWSGSDAIYAIADNQLDVQPGDDALLWNAYAFGADQEAYVTLVNIDPAGFEQDLLLKSQSSATWENGVIEVLYRAAEQQVQVWTYTPQQNWVKQGDDIPVQLVNGDQLGARARVDGTVEVYRNGLLLATRDVTTWPYYANGGYIGLWSIDAADAVLDDFGGATTGSIAPMPDLVAFWDDFDPSQETWTYTATLGTDDWQLATDYAHSLSHAYYTSDPDALKDDRLQTRSLVVPPHGQLTFWHTYQLENQCDGAVLEISTDGGITFADLGASILAGGYTGILTCSTNPILTRPAWTGGELGTMSQVTVDLSAFAGQTVLLRFRLVADDGTGGGGWYLDDVRVQGTQVAEILPRPGLNTLLAGASTGFYRSVDAPYSNWTSLASLYAAANTQNDQQQQERATQRVSTSHFCCC